MRSSLDVTSAVVEEDLGGSLHRLMILMPPAPRGTQPPLLSSRHITCAFTCTKKSSLQRATTQKPLKMTDQPGPSKLQRFEKVRLPNSKWGAAENEAPQAWRRWWMEREYSFPNWLGDLRQRREKNDFGAF